MPLGPGLQRLVQLINMHQPVLTSPPGLPNCSVRSTMRTKAMDATKNSVQWQKQHIEASFKAWSWERGACRRGYHHSQRFVLGLDPAASFIQFGFVRQTSGLLLPNASRMVHGCLGIWVCNGCSFSSSSMVVSFSAISVSTTWKEVHLDCFPGLSVELYRFAFALLELQENFWMTETWFE